MNVLIRILYAIGLTNIDLSQARRQFQRRATEEQLLRIAILAAVPLGLMLFAAVALPFNIRRHVTMVQSKQHAEEYSAILTQCSELIRIADMQLSAGRFDDATWRYREVIESMQRLPNLKQVLARDLCIGDVYQKLGELALSRSNVIEAERSFRQAASSECDTNVNMAKLQALVGLSTVTWIRLAPSMSIIAEAETAKSAILAELEYGSEGYEDNALRNELLCLQSNADEIEALVANDIGATPYAIAALEECIRVYEKANAVCDLLRAKCNIAIMYFRVGEVHRAERHVNDAIEIMAAQKLGQPMISEIQDILFITSQVVCRGAMHSSRGFHPNLIARRVASSNARTGS